MKYFILEIAGDNGKEFLKTNASTPQIAIDNFAMLYKAPQSAVKKVYEIDLMWWNFKSQNLINKGLAILVN